MKSISENLAAFAQQQTAARLKTLESNVRKTTKDPLDPGHIHDLRVAIRRFTQALRVFKNLWKRPYYRKIRRKLHELMDLCGEARNCDIALEVLEAAGAPASGELKGYLSKRRTEAGSDLSKRLEQWKSRQILHSWKQWLADQKATKQSIKTRTRQSLKPLHRDFLKTGARAAKRQTKPEDLHKLRLLGKRLRYSLEIFGVLAGNEWKQEVDGIRKVQDLLGAINDCVATGELVGEFGGGSALLESEAHLKALLDQRVETFRAHWRERGMLKQAKPKRAKHPGRKD